MGLFGKPTISEEEAAAQFVIAMLTGVRENWTKITGSFRTLMHKSEKLDSPWAQLEFGIATMSTQLRALANLFPAEQAERIRGYVLNCLSSAEAGEAALEALEAYDGAWDDSIEAGEPPFGAVAVRLCHRLKFGPSDIATVGEFMDPMFLMALGGAITTTFSGWWKILLGTHRVVA